MYLVYESESDSVGKHPLDIGIDLPVTGLTIVRPGQVRVVDTGVSFEFPVHGRIRRLITGLLLGVPITGIGGIIKPRSRSDLVVMAGVIDPGYRGTIKVKVYNPTRSPIYITEPFAQMVPHLCFGVDTVRFLEINTNTERGTSGGINQSPVLGRNGILLR